MLPLSSSNGAARGEGWSEGVSTTCLWRWDLWVDYVLPVGIAFGTLFYGATEAIDGWLEAGIVAFEVDYCPGAGFFLFAEVVIASIRLLVWAIFSGEIVLAMVKRNWSSIY